MEILLYIIFGIIGGVFGGMGMGGGTIIIPLLTIFLSVNQKLAQGYNLFAFLLMAVIVLIIYKKNNMVEFKGLLLIIIFGILSCVLGAYLTTVISSQILKYIFAGFLILLSVYEIVKVVQELKNKKKNKD